MLSSSEVELKHSCHSFEMAYKSVCHRRNSEKKHNLFLKIDPKGSIYNGNRRGARMDP